mmetsp:Transcript_52225/g.86524  ORF Transcript_52225/g.86524 Transcript_52225/m.86524 type:complete len:305 (+) Transcript_52225:147-1061(+)
MAVLGTTVHWSPGEVSLRRGSFNDIVKEPRLAGRRFDMPEGIMREKSMGRQAEFGSTWIPPGIHARRMTAFMTDRKAPGRRLPAQPPPGMKVEGTSFNQFQSTHQFTRSLQRQRPQSAPLSQVRSMPSLDLGGAEAQRGISKHSLLASPPASAASTSRQEASKVEPIALPGSSPGSGAASAPFTPASSVPGSARAGNMEAVLCSGRGSIASSAGTGDMLQGQLLRPQSAPAGRPGRPSSTTIWDSGESSLCRDSFNSMVQHRKVDTTEIMMRTAQMGRQAELGPSWSPPGIVARRMADEISKMR